MKTTCSLHVFYSYLYDTCSPLWWALVFWISLGVIGIKEKNKMVIAK